jgi:hypothetical protein
MLKSYRRINVALSLSERNFCSRRQTTLFWPQLALKCWLATMAVYLTSLPTHAKAPQKAGESAELEDLGADLFDDGAPTSNGGAAQRRLVQPEGEDLGAGQWGAGSADPLKLVKDRMRQAESVLAARDASGRASSAQQEAVSELDAMIAKLQKQCENCGGQCNKPGPLQNKPPKPGGKKGSKPGETSAVAATKPAPPVDKAAVGNLVKDLWGRLPERQREELLQPLSEEFLPEYAADIEEYFHVLAETPSDQPAEAQP